MNHNHDLESGLYSFLTIFIVSSFDCLQLAMVNPLVTDSEPHLPSEQGSSPVTLVQYQDSAGVVCLLQTDE